MTENVKMSFAEREALKRVQTLFGLMIACFAMEYLRPQEVFFPFLKPLKIPALMIIAIVWYCRKDLMTGMKHPMCKPMVAFILFMAVWVPFAKNNFLAFHTMKNQALYLFTWIIPFLISVNTQERLFKFAYSSVIIHGALGVLVMTHGGHGPGSYLWDENDVCSALAIGLPLALFLMSSSTLTRRQKIICIISGLCIVGGMVASKSRGGFLGLVVTFGVAVWLSERRWRNIGIILAVTATLSGVVYSLLPPGYVEDMQSISDPNDSTRLERFKLWAAAWEGFKDNPLFGVGPANTPWHHNEYVVKTEYYRPGQKNSHGMQTHSLYFATLSDLGLVGCGILYSMYLRGFLSSLRVLKWSKGKNNDLYLISKAHLAGTLGFFMAAAFISVMYYPIYWFLYSFVVATEEVMKKEIANASPVSNVTGNLRSRR